MDQTNLHFLYLKYSEANTFIGPQYVQSTAKVYLDFYAEWALTTLANECSDLLGVAQYRHMETLQYCSMNYVLLF